MLLMLLVRHFLYLILENDVIGGIVPGGGVALIRCLDAVKELQGNMKEISLWESVFFIQQSKHQCVLLLKMLV